MKTIVRYFILLIMILQSPPTRACNDSPESHAPTMGSPGLVSLINLTVSDLDHLADRIAADTNTEDRISSKKIVSLFKKITKEVKLIIQDPLSSEFKPVIEAQWPLALTSHTECTSGATCGTCTGPRFSGWDCNECGLGIENSWIFRFWNNVPPCCAPSEVSMQEQVKCRIFWTAPISVPIYPAQWVISPLVYCATFFCNGGSVTCPTCFPHWRTVVESKFLRDLAESLRTVLIELKNSLEEKSHDGVTTKQPSHGRAIEAEVVRVEPYNPDSIL